jgi:hypothetical protein
MHMECSEANKYKSLQIITKKQNLVLIQSSGISIKVKVTYFKTVSQYFSSAVATTADKLLVRRQTNLFCSVHKSAFT